MEMRVNEEARNAGNIGYLFDDDINRQSCPLYHRLAKHDLGTDFNASKEVFSLYMMSSMGINRIFLRVTIVKYPLSLFP